MNDETQKIRTLLKEVIDPELMINIIDLGLVYQIQHDPEGQSVTIDMTLSTPNCPLGDVITENVQTVIESNYPDFAVRVHLVWDPVWDLDMMTPAGKAALGWR